MTRVFVGFTVTVAVFFATVTGFRQMRSGPIRRSFVTLNNQIDSTADDIAVPPLCTEPPLKILLLVEPTPFNYVSGYANRFKEMLKFLKQAGDDVRVLTADKDPSPPDDYIGYPITTNRGFEFILYKHVTLTFDFKTSTKKLIEEFRPDLIHVSSPSSLIWAAILWSKWYDIPLVMSYHTDFVQYSKTYGGFPGAGWLAYRVLNWFHNRADMTLCTSPQLRDDLVLNAGVKRVGVWQKGINAERFSPSFRDPEMRKRLSQGDVDAPLLVYVGRIGAEKKINRLKKVLDANPGARLAFVGRGPIEDEMKAYFADYPVHFTGELQGDELSKAFASCDIFLMPSDSETLGFVVLEAMASGIPVVGVAAGGLVDIIDNDKTGYLVSNDDDMVEFAAKTKELIQNKEKRAQFGLNARTWAEGWSWETATSKLRNIQYRTAIRLHKARDVITHGHDDEIERALMSKANMYRPDMA